MYWGSIKFSCSVVSDSLRPYGLQHTRPPCPSPAPGIYSNSCPLSQWYHPTISSSAVPFSSRLQSFTASGSFLMSQFFASGFSFSISPSNEYSGLISFRMDWLDLLAVQGTLKSLLQHHSSKVSILRRLAFFIVQLSHPYMTTGKTIALTRWTLVGKVISLLFNMLSRLVIAFLPRSKCLLISWLQSPSAVILEPKNIKSLTVSTVFPSVCHEVRYWGIASQQCCDSFRWKARELSHTYTCIHSPPFSLSVFIYSHLGCHITLSRVPCAMIVGTCWLSILNVTECTCPSQTP